MSISMLKASLQRVVRILGLEVGRAKNAVVESVVLKNVIKATGASIVLDVGANAGQFGDLVFRGGFNGTLVSFEAIPAVHAKLVAYAKKRSPLWVVAPCAALGSLQGQVEINIAGNSVSSSLLPMTTTHLEAEPQSRYVERQLINIARLDELARSLVPETGAILMKVDTQGYEMEVLKGASGLLPRTVALQLELSLVPLYDGAPTFVEMVSFAEARGYELFSIVPGFRDRRSGRLLQVDGFFVRKGLLRH
jgi:FkbM family methyltransferase